MRVRPSAARSDEIEASRLQSDESSEGLLKISQNLLLVLHDGVQGGLILQNGRLIFLDRFLICLDGALVCENRFLVLQNVLLVCDYIILRHFRVPSFGNGVRATGLNVRFAKSLGIFIVQHSSVNSVFVGHQKGGPLFADRQAGR
jgi:hypothetical protein